MDNLETESIEETQDTEELEQPTEELEEREDADQTEGEESESDDDSTEAEDGERELLVLDDEEVDLDTVRKWKNGHLMQEDYTRKTQAVAEERKALKTKAEEFDAFASELEKELLADFDPKELEELRDYDPSAYLKRKDQLDAKRQKVASLRSKAAQARDELDNKIADQERQKLLKANPDWLDATGNPTEKYQKDVSLMNNYLSAQGWTPEEVSQINSAKMWSVIKEAAELKAARAKSTGLKKKVTKAPTVTKPQSTRAKAPKPKTYGSMLYGD